MHVARIRIGGFWLRLGVQDSSQHLVSRDSFHLTKMEIGLGGKSNAMQDLHTAHRHFQLKRILSGASDFSHRQRLSPAQRHQAG